MSTTTAYRERSDIERFLACYMQLHDAEVLSVSLSANKRTLKVSLANLCIIDPKTNWWRTTDTDAILTFDMLSDVKIHGELEEYDVNFFEISDGGSFSLICTSGTIRGKCGEFEISAVSKSEVAV